MSSSCESGSTGYCTASSALKLAVRTRPVWPVAGKECGRRLRKSAGFVKVEAGIGLNRSGLARGRPSGYAAFAGCQRSPTVKISCSSSLYW